MKNNPDLSIVIPSYNEKRNISKIINAYEQFAHKFNFELIYVDNGSNDGTSERLQKYSEVKRYSFLTPLRINKNIGYGHGIMAGVRKCRADIIAWTHADMQTPPADVFKAYTMYCREKNLKTIVKGRRKKRPTIDAFVSKSMGWIASLLLGVKLDEINAQPKLFNRNLIKALAGYPNDFSLDLFLLYRAKKLGYTVLSFDVEYFKRRYGRSKWAYSWRSKLRMIRKTFLYILSLSLS